MKTKNVLILIISIILICIPTQAFAWLTHETYIACNKINFSISALMNLMSFIVIIGYITGTLGYIRYSKQERKQKINNILIWLVITILQTAILMLGAKGVYKVGMEEYWIDTGRIKQVSEIRGFFSSMMRVTALTTILTYLISGIIYFAKSEEEKYKKFKKLVKWELIVAIVLIITLYIAKIL